MRNMIAFSCVVAVALLSASRVEAGPKKGGKKDPAQVFQKRDKDGSGSLSLAELNPKGKKDPAATEKRFKKLDRNRDGKLSLDELKAAKARKKGA